MTFRSIGIASEPFPRCSLVPPMLDSSIAVLFHKSICVSLKEALMPRTPLESLGAMVKARRGERRLREVAAEIGIGVATLMRVENGRIPDVATFGKLCRWLDVEPGTFLGFEKKRPAE